MTSAPAWLTGLASRDDIGDHPWFVDHPPPPDAARRSAVLVLFGPGDDVHGPGRPDVVLTERAHTLRSHPGQVSFPGGREEPVDTGPVDAALREAEEEVGIDPASVDVLAALPPLYLAPSRHAVTPVLGWWRVPGPVRAVDRAEVERADRVAVADLLAPAHRFTAVFGPYRGPGFEVGGLFVWGFTAMLLDAVFELAGVTEPWDTSLERHLPDRVRSPWMRGADAMTPGDGAHDGRGRGRT
ncbi:NUDIX hydrolase [Phycicoccus avicenniae]|nr:CoA pyrophosphatase [Phycicoccus avicenniae]